MSLITSKKEFKGIDFIKFIMAIFVVAIHTHPFEGLHENVFIQIWNLITSFAVPYFFIASGFFLFLKVKKENHQSSQSLIIKLYGIRIIKLYIYWTLIYLPITIWGFINNDSSVFKDFLSFIKGLFFVGQNFYSWPLWYLLSMIYSLALIWLLVRRSQKIESIFIISIIIFFISVLMNFILMNESSNIKVLTLSKIIKITFGSGRLFSGMLYMMIGALFANHIINFSKNLWFVLLSVGLLFQVFWLPFISPFMFVLLPTVIFHFSIGQDYRHINHGYFFRKCSTVIYFTHMIVFFFYTLICKEFRYYGWDAFLVSIVIPIILTPLILNNENKFPLLKKIF